jgi:hypothetical protein
MGKKSDQGTGGSAADAGGRTGSSDAGWPVPVRDRGKAPNRPVVPFGDGNDPAPRVKLSGPLAAKVPPERPAQGEGHC